MGTVYRAHDPLIDRTVAIKTVSCAGFSREESEAFEERFYREAKSAGRLNHPNIVTIHDVGRSGDLAYIAMEFLSGRTLRDILDSGVVLPLERIAKIAIEIANGLAFAHANHVVHRDIKPGNIMVLDNNSVKIADFGVALLPNSAHTMLGTVLGSPKYMSPEQITGKSADGRSDIFSLGVVLYEMLTGRPPFDGDSLEKILDQVLHSAPPLPSTFIPDLPHGFDRIVARAMAKDPDKRYQDAAEMAAHLRKYRRIVIQEKREKGRNTDISRPVSATPATGPGAETVQIKPLPKTTAVSTPAGKSRMLRYGVPSFLIVLLLAVGAAWLLRPGAPPPPLVAKAAAVAPENKAPPPAPAASPPPVTVPAPETETREASAAPPAGRQPATPEPVIAATEARTAVSEPAVQTGAPSGVSKPAPEATPSAPPEGRIRLAVAPWGEVFVDGKKAGTTPPLTVLHLPAGKHNIEIRNTSFKPFRQQVDLAPNGTLRLKHKFE